MSYVTATKCDACYAVEYMPSTTGTEDYDKNNEDWLSEHGEYHLCPSCAARMYCDLCQEIDWSNNHPKHDRCPDCDDYTDRCECPSEDDLDSE
jgi:hypothetical protein